LYDAFGRSCIALLFEVQWGKGIRIFPLFFIAFAVYVEVVQAQYLPSNSSLLKPLKSLSFLFSILSLSI